MECTHENIVEYDCSCDRGCKQCSIRWQCTDCLKTNPPITIEYEGRKFTGVLALKEYIKEPGERDKKAAWRAREIRRAYIENKTLTRNKRKSWTTKNS